MFRHGDRTPLLQNPGDMYDITYWPDGWGQLTKVSQRDHFTELVFTLQLFITSVRQTATI